MLRRQYGVSPQISIKDRAVWFEWPRDLALDFAALDKDVEKSSLKAREMHLIGTFDVSQQSVVREGFVMSSSLPLKQGESLSGGKVTLDIKDFQNPSARVGEMITLKTYQP